MFDVTAEALKELLSTPAALFFLMLIASFGSALKQMSDARDSNSSVTFGEYFLKNWPVTLITIGHNIIAFGGLIMTDSLNWASALGIGYVANSVADKYPVGNRTASINGKLE